ncbi:AbrB/MazE/SpoVT family DNA-binding domain-containing protein [uncultured Agrobacterium sp.]|uniref:AbrB/MazE/SpoVT family DNA-binding domain-containing protein n=1 Tax=uncultured Agrobacterium sp. TaxID=157277 RepID=UPI00258B5CA4|nr:AbrB/MazE/SpoVT family DNA-binding domain-containing protein [uncultured Agrobacterium sp.]
MGFQTTITSKGQMTVPKNVRDELEIKPGDKCYVWVRHREMIVVPRNKSVNDLAGILGKPPNGRKLAIEEIDSLVGDAVSEEYSKLSRSEINE